MQTRSWPLLDIPTVMVQLNAPRRRHSGDRAVRRARPPPARLRKWGLAVTLEAGELLSLVYVGNEDVWNTEC